MDNWEMIFAKKEEGICCALAMFEVDARSFGFNFAIYNIALIA